MKTQTTQQILSLKKNYQRKKITISVDSIKKWVVKLELPLPVIEWDLLYMYKEMGKEMILFIYQKPTHRVHQDNSTIFLSGMKSLVYLRE